MDDLKTGQIYYVNMESTDLRREPTMNPKARDGQDNVILSLQASAEVILESREVRTADGHHWYNIRYIQDDMAVVGWIISASVQHDPPGSGFVIPVTGSFDVTDVEYKGTRKWDIAKLMGDPAKGVKLTHGLVKYKIPGEKDYTFTTPDDWKAVAGERYPLD